MMRCFLQTAFSITYVGKLERLYELINQRTRVTYCHKLATRARRYMCLWPDFGLPAARESCRDAYLRHNFRATRRCTWNWFANKTRIKGTPRVACRRSFAIIRLGFKRRRCSSASERVHKGEKRGRKREGGIVAGATPLYPPGNCLRASSLKLPLPSGPFPPLLQLDPSSSTVHAHP